MYTIDEFNQLYSFSGSLERQVQFVYNQNQRILRELNKMKDEQNSLVSTAHTVNALTKQVNTNEARIKQLIASYNDLIAALKCRFDAINTRLTKLEEGKVNAGIQSL